VARFSIDVNGNTRTMHTEVEIPNTGNRLVPGLYAEAVMTLNQRNNVLVVPLQAVIRTGEKTSVYVVLPDDRLQDRQVTLGTQMPDYIEVSMGLRVGEQVVVSDRGGLKPGDLIKPKPVEPIAYEGSAQQ
jgi:Cu(I)/Ag(I) efflux system membrane fusion protein